MKTKTFLNEIGFLAGAKGRGRVRESVYPKLRKQHHKVNRESCCRAKESNAMNHREMEDPGSRTSWAQRNFGESPQETGSSVWVQLCAAEAPQQVAALLNTKKCKIVSESVTVTHWVKRTSFCLLCELLQRLTSFLTQTLSSWGQNMDKVNPTSSKHLFETIARSVGLDIIMNNVCFFWH